MNENTQEKQEEIPELGIDGLKEFKRTVKFGDTVINGFASENNRGRVGFFVKMSEKHIECTDGEGYFYRPVLDTHSKLKIASPAAPESYPRWKELLDWIDEQKKVAQQGYVKAEDEESRTMYSSENITYSLVIDKIKALMYESPSPEVNVDELVNALNAITHSLGIVNFSSHNQMREAIEESLSVADSAIAGYNAALNPNPLADNLKITHKHTK